MKNNSFVSIMIKFIITPFLLTTSCVNEISEDSVNIPSEIPIRLSTQILCNHTRAINNEFQENDAIGLYVLKQPSAINQERYIDNVRFTCSQATGFEPEDTIYYPKGDSKCDFISYYPYKEAGIKQEQSVMQIQIYADQSSINNHSLSDFMVATNNDITPSQNMVSMEYKHKLCKLKIKIKPATGEDIEEILNDNPTLSLNGFHSDASYDFMTNQFESLEQTVSVTPHGKWEIVDDVLIGKDAILIPEKTESDSHYITIYIDGKSYSCPFPDNFQLISEKECSITIIYKPSKGIEIKYTNHTIQDWTEGDSGETPAQETSEIVHLSALRFNKSNVYKVICEGTQVAEICKEYLLADNIDAQAIVAYPILNGETDLSDGRVICLLNETAPVHGGNVSWDRDNNQLSYTAGDLSIINNFYITKENSISISKPENPLSVSLQEDVLTDIRNKEIKVYPIVKIGMQYWMGSSLETAYYTDGEAITLKKDFTTEAGYYTGKYKDALRDFYFYNSKAAISKKLSPQGWSIPTESEWVQLIQYLKNDASKLKSGTWFREENSEIFPSLNTTGFNGLSEGYIHKITKGYTNGLRTVVYWSTNSTGDQINKAFYLLHNSNEINEGNTVDRSASVRCIRKKN